MDSSVNDLISLYNGLVVADQTVLQALSALYEPASAGVVSSCLNSAGLRESPLRAFSVQNVSVRLARLQKLGLVRADAKSEKKAKIVLWSCRPDAGELALRHTLREGRFTALARAAIAGTRGKDWHKEGAGESLRRNLRLAFHAGSWDAAAKEAGLMRGETPGSVGKFLNLLVANQSDDTWLPTRTNLSFEQLFALALDELFIVLGDSEALTAACEKYLPRDSGFLACALGNAALLQGKFRAAKKLLDAMGDSEYRSRLELGLAFMQGEDEKALSLGASLLAAERRRLSTRSQVLSGIAGVWLALSALRLGRTDDMERLAAALGSVEPGEPFYPECACIRLAALFRLGQSYAVRSLPEGPEHFDDSPVSPLAVLLHGLTSLWLSPGRLAPLVARLDDVRRRARSAGYRWLASQTARLVARAGDIDASAQPGENWPLLADAFLDQDEWRRGLAALSELSLPDNGAGQTQTRRIAWLVGPAQKALRNPYCPFVLHPVEQSMGKSGQWTKGRNISLRRLFQERGAFSYAGEQDKMAFSALRHSADYDEPEFYFDVGQALHYLIGHPHVFRDDSGGAKIDVVQGEFELSAVEKDGGFAIALEPPLSEFLAAPALSKPGTDEDDDDWQDSASGAELASPPDYAAKLETPTRLRVMSLSERDKRMVMVIGDGLAVPPAGREEALTVLESLPDDLRIHSDIPELASEGETVEADPRPRFHIMPLMPGLKVEVWAHPLGDEGPAYRPGCGGKILSTEVDGSVRRVVRDLGQEKQLASQAVRGCPTLLNFADGELSWRMEDPEACLAFMVEVGDLGDNVVLTWPKGGRFRVRRLSNPASIGLKIARNADWLELDGEIKIDENLTISMGQLLAAARDATGHFVAIGEGEFLALTKELQRQLAEIESFAEAQGDRVRLPILAGGLLEDLEAMGADVKADFEWRRFLEKRKDLAQYKPALPAGFGGELRDYQIDGFQWLARLAAWGAGACLADDMGLGKTVQALALLTLRSGEGPALVVAPTSVCHNWQAEATRFTPGLRVIPFGDGDRDKVLSDLGPGDLLVASYGLLQVEGEKLARIKWATVILDEAQAIKNFATKRSKAAMNLDAGFRLITTGTPIENHLGELWNLFRFINPHLLGSWRRFQERFASPVERHGDEQARDALRKVIRPFILRRTKNQVLGSLPPKTEITLEVEMGNEERAFYEALRREAVERLSATEGDLEKKRFQILSEIMKLRRACCSPELITGDRRIPSAKQEQFQQTLAELLANKHKALVFSQFVAHLDILRRHLDKEGIAYQYLDGSTTPRRRKQAVEAFQSGKGDVFLISLKAGGLGLNLTAADYVIHMDPWWNPAVEDQASDRAHRIGQTRPVTVYRIVAARTIEDKIVELHRRKRDLADNLLSGADQSHALDIDEIMRLLRED